MQRLLLLALGLILTLAIGSSLAEAAGRNASSRSSASASRNERKPRFNKNARKASAALSPRQLGSAYSLLQGLHKTGARLILRSKALAERQNLQSRQAALSPKASEPPPAPVEPPPAPVAPPPVLAQQEPAQPVPSPAEHYVPDAAPVAPAPSEPAAAPVIETPAEPEVSPMPEARAAEPTPAPAPDPPPAVEPAPAAPPESAEPAEPAVQGLSAEQIQEAAADVAKVPKLRSNKVDTTTPAQPPAETEAPVEPEPAGPAAETQAAEASPDAAASNSLDGLAQTGQTAEDEAPTPEEESEPPPAAEPEPQPEEPEKLNVRSFGLGNKRSNPAPLQAPVDSGEEASQPEGTADELLEKSSTDAEAEAGAPAGNTELKDEKISAIAGSRAEAPERAMPALPTTQPEAEEDHPDQHTHDPDPADLPGSETEGKPALSRPRLAAESLSPRRAEALQPPLEDPSLQAQLEPAAGGLGAANSSVQLNAMLTPLPSLRSLAISPMLGGPGGRPIEAPTEILSHFGTPRMREGQVPRDLVSLERGNGKRKLVALTFDDGPHPEYTSQLLAVLEHYDVRASFEMVGVQMVRYPQWVKMTHLAGHEIASHTYDHFRLPKLPLEEKVYQIDENQRLVEQLTGETPRFLRPPGGQLDPETQRICQQRGIVVAMWDVGLNDLKTGRSARDLVSTALKETKPGSILLAHDGSQAMIDALPDIIEGLRAKGYEFVTLTELASQL